MFFIKKTIFLWGINANTPNPQALPRLRRAGHAPAVPLDPNPPSLRYGETNNQNSFHGGCYTNTLHTSPGFAKATPGMPCAKGEPLDPQRPELGP
jgi:hypothetical protein